MTDVEYESTDEEGAGGQIEPIHVVLDGAAEKEVTPEFGSWMTVSWPAATSAQNSAQRIIPEARMRSKAQIIVYAGAAAAAGAFVLVGHMGQVMNGQGGQLQPGRYPVENSQELWAASDGVNAMIVTVLDERYL
jgi:hypothetical protein